MDVDELLRLIRQDIADFRAARSYEAEAAAGDLLAQRVTDLDEWLSRGGFLPADWNKGRLTLKRGE